CLPLTGFWASVPPFVHGGNWAKRWQGDSERETPSLMTHSPAKKCLQPGWRFALAVFLPTPHLPPRNFNKKGSYPRNAKRSDSFLIQFRTTPHLLLSTDLQHDPEPCGAVLEARGQAIAIAGATGDGVVAPRTAAQDAIAPTLRPVRVALGTLF